MLLKTVHSFLQLEVSEIKIAHRFQKYPPLHALSCRVSISLPLTTGPKGADGSLQKTFFRGKMEL